MNVAKSWFMQLYLQRLEGLKHKKWKWRKWLKEK